MVYAVFAAFKNSTKKEKAEVPASVCLRRAVELGSPGLEVKENISG